MIGDKLSGKLVTYTMRKFTPYTSIFVRIRWGNVFQQFIIESNRIIAPRIIK